MKIKNIQLLTWAVVIALLMSCSQEKYTEPFGSDSAPGLVTDVTVTSLKGGAQIKYKLPADPNLRYVKAVYTVNGQEMEKVASRYDNAIEIHGFPDTREQEIKLYSVSKAGNVSSGFVSAKVSPLTPPVVESFQSLEVNATFGGVLLTFDNPAEANLAVIIRTPDANGNMNIVDTYYTSTVQGIYAIRGFAPEERPFEFVIRDRWGNLSDTLKGSYTPIFEQIISKSGFQALQLQTDTWQPHTALGPQYTMDKIWDGAMGDSPPHPIFHTPPSGTMPKWFTFDMGVVAQLSRFKLFHRRPGRTYAYRLGAPKKFEIWGSATAPDPSGSWDSWTHVMDCDSFKPSGEANPNVTDDDIDYACIQGEDFMFPPDAPPVRYIRVLIREVWGSVAYFYIDELTFWGSTEL